MDEMPPPQKKLKIQQKNIIADLASFQDRIRKIKGEVINEVPETTVEEKQEVLQPEEENVDYLEDPFLENGIQQENNNEEIKKFIQLSEKRINQRLERIEQKLNKLLEKQGHLTAEEEPVMEEQHLVEYVEQENTSELDNRLFPITDEATFDWFFNNLKDDEYRLALITRRWPLTRNVNMKTINIAVKEFLRMHFDLPVCVKYSCSGYGSHGSKKNKLDTKTLSVYVFECFSSGFPGVNSYSDINKAIVQFWGRAPDTLSKENERAIKREIL